MAYRRTHITRLLSSARMRTAALVVGAALALTAAHGALAAATSFQLSGIEGRLRDNAYAHLSTLDISCAAPRWQAESLIPRAEAAVRRALEALGHYSPTLRSTLQRPGDCWRLHIEVHAGPPVRIVRLDLALTGSGQHDAGLKKLLDTSGLHLGATLDQGLYSELKSRLERYTRDHGYFDARFSAHAIRIDPADNTADIQLVLDTGPRYDFGPTTLQQDVLEPRLVRGFLGYRQGQPYSGDAVVESQSTLVGTGYFDTVRLRSLIDQRAGGEVPMHLALTPAPRYQLLTGVGYATDTGPRLRLDFRNRRVNRAGHRYSLTSQLSPVQSQAGLKYEIPLSGPRTDWLTLESGYRYEKTDTALTHSWKLGIARTHLMANRWLRRLSLEYLHETSTVAGQKLTSQLLIPGVGFSRTVADSPIYPRRGWSASAELRGAAKGIVSDASFAQATLHLKDIRPLGSGRLFTRVNLGATSVSDITLLPASLRFFAGGDNSVRGYAYQSLGPTDDAGNVIGGKYLVTASAEYDHRLLGDFYWAAFYDVGNAFNTLPLNPRRGVGMGLRWHSPLGPVRLDVAHPLDGTGNYFRLHVSMGPEL